MDKDLFFISWQMLKMKTKPLKPAGRLCSCLEPDHLFTFAEDIVLARAGRPNQSWQLIDHTKATSRQTVE